MPTYRATAIVTRTHKLGESDRIVTLLTRERGLIRAVGRGVRKTTSKMGSRLEPFNVIEVQCFEGRSLDTVTQAEIVGAYGAELASDYRRWTVAHTMAEAAEKLVSEEGAPARQEFLLLYGGLRFLASNDHDPGLILDSFLLRSLAVAGWAPSFDVCARCGTEGPHRHFHAAAGGALCRSCRVAGSATPTEGTLELMGALLAGDWQAADASDDRQRRDAAGVTAAYLHYHLERSLKSLPHVERSL